MSVILAVETAFAEVDVALAVDGELRRAQQELAAQRGSALHAAIAELLGQGDEAPVRPDEIRVDLGPGSYTGLRVGLAFVRTWKLLHPTRVRACFSTDLLARQATEQLAPDTEFVVLLDARRGQWFGTRYRQGGDGLRRLGKPVCLRPAKLVGWAGAATRAFGVEGGGAPAQLPAEWDFAELPVPRADLLLAEEELLFDDTEPAPVYLMPPV